MSAIQNFNEALAQWLNLSSDEAKEMNLSKKISYGMMHGKPFYKSKHLRKLFGEINSLRDMLALDQLHGIPVGFFTVLANADADPSTRIARYHELQGDKEIAGTSRHFSTSSLFFESQVPVLLQLNATLDLIKSCTLDVNALRDGNPRFCTLINLAAHQEGVTRFCRDLIEDYQKDLADDDASIAWSRLFITGLTFEHAGNVALAEMIYASLTPYPTDDNPMDYRIGIMSSQVATLDDFDLVVRRMSHIEKRDMLPECLSILAKSVRIHDIAPNHDLVNTILKERGPTCSQQYPKMHQDLSHEILRVIMSSTQSVIDQYRGSIDLDNIDLSLPEVTDFIQRFSDLNMRVLVSHDERLKRIEHFQNLVDKPTIVQAMKQLTRECIQELQIDKAFPSSVVHGVGLVPDLIDIQLDLAKQMLGKHPHNPSEEHQAVEASFVKRLADLILSQCRKLNDEGSLEDSQLLKAANQFMHLPAGIHFLDMLHERKIPVRKLDRAVLADALTNSFSL